MVTGRLKQHAIKNNESKMKSKKLKNTLRQVTMKTHPYKIYGIQQRQLLRGKFIVIQAFLKKMRKISILPIT